jgi:type IV secretory pathway VirB4 component
VKASDILHALEGDKTHSGTHMHILGSTGVGKSYFLEFILREAILSNRGFCFVDWHGTTYKRLV